MTTDLGRRERRVVIIGTPEPLRRLLTAEFRDEVAIDCVCTIRDGALRLELTATGTRHVIENAFGDVSHPVCLMIALLPYVRVADEIVETINLIDGFGSRVIRPTPNADGWPPASAPRDDQFQRQLFDRIVREVRDWFGIEKLAAESATDDQDREVMCELLRGLITHSKMGENNHSHEDDFWKSRGQGMTPKAKHALVMKMKTLRLIRRKKNKSIGGTGCVYWIDDVAEVRRLFPELEVLFR